MVQWAQRIDAWRRSEERPGECVQLALALLAGWWLGCGVSGALDLRAHRIRCLDQPPTAAGSIRPLPYPRALRQAAGVGRRRSVDLARFYWCMGTDASADAIYGVGPKTALAAESALEAYGIGPPFHRGVARDGIAGGEVPARAR